MLFSAFIDYRFSDGSKRHILQDCAWCPNCGRFVIAEEIPSIESLEAEIKKFEDGDPELVAVWRFVSNGEPISNRISELKKRIRWRMTRKNPPRCLECGGFGVVSLPGGNEFLHPSTGERVIEVSAGWTDAAPWCAEFTPEGDLLGEPSHFLDEPSGEPEPPMTRVLKP